MNILPREPKTLTFYILTVKISIALFWRIWVQRKKFFKKTIIFI